MKSITFSAIASFLGRNGLFKAIGLDVYIRDTMAVCSTENNPTKTLCITPTTSKGQAARCEIEVPVSDIGAFVEAIGSQLKTEGHWKGSDYGRWIDDNASASSFDNHLFRLFLYASEKDAFRILGAFPEKFITL